MPAQDRVRGDQAMATQRSGQPPDERGEHGSVRPPQAWSRVAAPEHGDHVSQHEELDVLGPGRAAQQQEQSERVLEDASDLLDVVQAAGSAAHSVPRATVGWLGCFLPPSGWLTHSVPLAVARPRRGSTEA